jgi:hypothetical protein
MPSSGRPPTGLLLARARARDASARSASTGARRRRVHDHGGALAIQLFPRDVERVHERHHDGRRRRHLRDRDQHRVREARLAAGIEVDVDLGVVGTTTRRVLHPRDSSRTAGAWMPGREHR